MSDTKDERRFARIVTVDEDADATGFFWCGGPWESRDYRCVLLAVAGNKRRRAAIEIRGTTPEELAEQMAAKGLDPLPAEQIRSLCETADLTRRRPRPSPTGDAE